MLYNLVLLDYICFLKVLLFTKFFLFLLTFFYKKVLLKNFLFIYVFVFCIIWLIDFYCIFCLYSGGFLGYKLLIIIFFHFFSKKVILFYQKVFIILSYYIWLFEDVIIILCDIQCHILCLRWDKPIHKQVWLIIRFTCLCPTCTNITHTHTIIAIIRYWGITCDD